MSAKAFLPKGELKKAKLRKDLSLKNILNQNKRADAFLRNPAAGELGPSTQRIECSVAVARTSGDCRWSNRSGLRRKASASPPQVINKNSY